MPSLRLPYRDIPSIFPLSTPISLSSLPPRTSAFSATVDSTSSPYPAALDLPQSPLPFVLRHCRRHLLPRLLWALDRSQSLRTFLEQSCCVYSIVWHPRHADVITFASGDRTVFIWDVRDPNSMQVVPAHDHEILTCDWNKYDECVFATGSVDRSIRV
ncbi:hypothetical protein MLD38_025959 [Melastoma candidum]|uniref:Uncharacterized protein n=1 Tax=Melastoma candidum TaxID=119954 RepID=A0ACB9NYF1_9MYRT|nr:hypothetical protein MLD38_025959 [Melastoma candidum]